MAQALLRPAPIPRAAALLCAALAFALAAGCATVPPQRTLPPSVRSVTVPVAVNRSAEPGIEDLLTVYTQEEFLADGRLSLVRPDDADAIIEIEIREYEPRAFGFDQDDFARTQSIETRAFVRILRNQPGRPPIGAERVVTARSFRNSDQRAIGFDPEPRAQEEAMRRLARNIVKEVLTGEFPEEAPTRLPLDR